MKKFLVTVCLFVCISGWYSCTRDIAVAPNYGTCNTSLITYNNTISRIVSTSCTAIGGCHNTTSGLGSVSGINATDLTTYAAVRAETIDSTDNNSILCRIEGTTCGLQMPYSARPFTQAQIDTFKMWKANNYCQGN